MPAAPSSPPAIIRCLSWLAKPLSFRHIYWLAKGVGTLAWYFSRNQRRRVMGNLSLASTLNLDEQRQRQVAKASFQNLYAVTFDYLKLANLSTQLNGIRCENPEVVQQLIDEGSGVVIVTGHLCNWEVTFLDESSRAKGIAISQRFFVNAVADWINAMRCQFGGELVAPNNAVKAGLKALRTGKFASLACDQALPQGKFSLPFLGTRAWTTTTPALWAIRSNCPIVLVTAHRDHQGYTTRHSSPIWPEKDAPYASEIRRLTTALNQQLEEAIKHQPENYLWLHNRYQQHTHTDYPKTMQHDVILVILPLDPSKAKTLHAEIPDIAAFYPRGLITVLTPLETDIAAPDETQIETRQIRSIQDALIEDWRYQLVFDYNDDSKVRRHYRKLGAFTVMKLSPERTLKTQLFEMTRKS